VTATDNADPIPDGSVLFTCQFDAVAAGTSEITVSNGIVSDAEGNETDATGTNGSVTVAEASPTPTATATPEEPTATNTPAEPTATATRTPRPGGGGGQDDDGCQMVAPADASMGWILLAPAALLIWRRRRAL
jgi:hypothetical protein